MKKSELLFGLLALLALALRFFALNGGAQLMIIALTALAILYFYFGFALLNRIPFRRVLRKESYRSLSGMRIVGAIAAGIALSQVVVGILFKLLRWPGAYEMLLIGLMSLTLVFAVAVIRYTQSKAAFYPSVLFRMTLFGSIGLLLILQP
jgi:hypothetical protein